MSWWWWWWFDRRRRRHDCATLHTKYTNAHYRKIIDPIVHALWNCGHCVALTTLPSVCLCVCVPKGHTTVCERERERKGHIAACPLRTCDSSRLRSPPALLLLLTVALALALSLTNWLLFGVKVVTPTHTHAAYSVYVRQPKKFKKKKTNEWFVLLLTFLLIYLGIQHITQET